MIIPAILDAIADTPPAPEPTVAARELRPGRSSVSRIVDAASVLPPRWRAFGDCVIARESHGNPRAINGSSGAAGIAQWLPAWRHGLPYVLARGLRYHGASLATATAVRRTVTGVPIHRWPERLQRVAFAQSLREGQWRHWSLPGSRCEGLVAR